MHREEIKVEKRWGKANIVMQLLTSEKTTRREKSMYQAFKKESVRARDESRGDGVHTTYGLTFSLLFHTVSKEPLNSLVGGQAGWYHSHFVDQYPETQKA